VRDAHLSRVESAIELAKVLRKVREHLDGDDIAAAKCYGEGAIAFADARLRAVGDGL
jgi:hypothetical protein